MEMSHTIFAGLVIGNMPFYYLLGRQLFDGWGEFTDSVRMFLVPGEISLTRGDVFGEIWMGVKLVALVSVSAACVYGEYNLIERLIA